MSQAKKKPSTEQMRRVGDKVLMTHDQAAQYLGLSRNALWNLRGRKKGPACTKTGPFPNSPLMYFQHDLDAWLEQQTDPAQPTIKTRSVYEPSAASNRSRDRLTPALNRAVESLSKSGTLPSAPARPERKPRLPLWKRAIQYVARKAGL